VFPSHLDTKLIDSLHDASAASNVAHCHRGEKSDTDARALFVYGAPPAPAEVSLARRIVDVMHQIVDQVVENRRRRKDEMRMERRASVVRTNGGAAPDTPAASPAASHVFLDGLRWNRAHLNAVWELWFMLYLESAHERLARGGLEADTPRRELFVALLQLKRMARVGLHPAPLVLERLCVFAQTYGLADELWGIPSEHLQTHR
jgi:hypothetical protein